VVKRLDMPDDVNALDFNSDGSLLAVGADACVRVFDTRSGQSTVQLRNAQQAVMSVCFSQDGCMVLGGCNDGAARLWDLRLQRIKVPSAAHA
jgi:U4/U6 small nuclear ribonucleoprotein PRP4